MRIIIIAAVAMVTTARVHGEPEDHKSESTATWLSVGGAAAAYVGIAEMTRVTDHATGLTDAFAVGVDIAACLALPALGHFYASDWHPTGVAVRAAGLGVIALGAFSDRSCDDEPCGGTALVLAGGLAVVAGTIYDIATASDAAHEYNYTHHLSIAPTMLNSPSGPTLGMGFTGQF